jgi:hypothetical protein
VRDNSSLGDDKSIVDDYSQSLNSANSELNSGSQSVFLFRVNIQRGDFLKGKFALCCKNYNDALFFFIRAAKKKSIVLDGLIQKKSLKHIKKIVIKLKKKLETYGIRDQPAEKKMLEYEKIKFRSTNKKQNHYSEKNYNLEEGKDLDEKSENTFGKEMEIIKEEIEKDISECNAKQSKDLIILIDFNSYDMDSNNNNNITNKVESFIDTTKTILNNYLSNNDRLGVFIFTNQYQIMCPLMCKDEIDINNFSKDLMYYKKKYFHEFEATEDFDMNENEFQNEKIEFPSNNDNFLETRQVDSIDEDDIERNKKIYLEIISELLKSINYARNYLKMKEGIKNEKYIILFTDLFNYFKITDEDVGKKFSTLAKDKEVQFLLVGKNTRRSNKNEKDEEEEKKLNEIILENYGDRSELIAFENMKKIKTIFSSNNVIKDEVIYPNEIYK